VTPSTERTASRSRVLVTWARAHEIRPRTTRHSPFSTVARFERLRDNWPEQAWSVVIEDAVELEMGRKWRGWVRLLNPDGPAELLAPGETFDLMAGDRVLGTAVVQAAEASAT
jgi:hypothetical protein